MRKRTFRFSVGSGKRIVAIKAASVYAAKQKLLGKLGLADGTRYELIRPPESGPKTGE